MWDPRKSRKLPGAPSRNPPQKEEAAFRLPGEQAGRGEWRVSEGSRGIALIITDKAFVKSLAQRIREAGISIVLETGKGGVQLSGRLSESVVERFLVAYVRTAREHTLEEAVRDAQKTDTETKDT